MLTATCMQRGESRAAVMMVQGAAAGPVFARRRCRTEPTSSHCERRNSSSATPPYAEQSPGSCPRPRSVPLHQEPGSERSSSRTRGADLACDGPTCRAKGGSCAAPRLAARAQRRHLARNKAQGGALGVLVYIMALVGHYFGRRRGGSHALDMAPRTQQNWEVR